MAGFIRRIVQQLLPESAFAKAIAMLAGGTAASQLLGVVVLPIVTRLFSPEAFGILAAYAALLMTVLTIAALRYELAIPLAETDREAMALLLIALGIVVTFAFVSMVGSAVIVSGVADFDVLTDVAPVAWLLPVGILAAGTYQTLRYWAIRERRYKVIASTTITQSIGRSAIQVLAGVFGASSSGLVVGEIVGHGAGLYRLARQARARFKDMLPAPRLDELISVARAYVSFPALMAPASFLNGAGMQLPTLLLAGLYGPSVAGWYFATQRLLAAPVQLVGTAVGQAFLGEAAKLARTDPGELLRMFNAVVLRLLMLGIVPAILLVFLGPWVTELLLGSGWREAGVYLQWLSVSFLFKFSFDDLINLAMVDANDYALAWAATRLVLACGSIILANHLGWSSTSSVALLGAAFALSYLLKLWLWRLAIRRLQAGAE